MYGGKVAIQKCCAIQKLQQWLAVDMYGGKVAIQKCCAIQKLQQWLAVDMYGGKVAIQKCCAIQKLQQPTVNSPSLGVFITKTCPVII